MLSNPTKPVPRSYPAAAIGRLTSSSGCARYDAGRGLEAFDGDEGLAGQVIAQAYATTPPDPVGLARAIQQVRQEPPRRIGNVRITFGLGTFAPASTSRAPSRISIIETPEGARAATPFDYIGAPCPR